MSVSFSPDGTRIVSGSQDTTIRLWDLATGKPVGEPLWGHTRVVDSVSFSRDGTRIISSSWDGTVRVWHAVIGKSLQDHTEEDYSPSSSHCSCILHPTPVVPTPNTANDDFISFSSNPTTHALRDTAELLAGTSYDDHTFVLGEDGWAMGPNRRLLFWVPPASRKLFYNPRTVLVIPRGGVELDLSCMAHGTRWQHCRKNS
ncbi:WD40-repeat-containing domain protein [Suillus plorans]|uniref:WD40-repeat-containing domain protein n=1 Tax=Suillus plorans TaxID=116603 RepID=A0A9P7AR79_9AGAM|nr:WD40-repeat-containing domain protein [Suillus plorans]KAG1794787.1 WD40-repeat-containing domain protein [Suillus plorans]